MYALFLPSDLHPLWREFCANCDACSIFSRVKHCALSQTWANNEAIDLVPIFDAKFCTNNDACSTFSRVKYCALSQTCASIDTCAILIE